MIYSTVVFSMSQEDQNPHVGTRAVGVKVSSERCEMEGTLLLTLS